MIDEIPIIGVTGWTVEGLSAKVDFADPEGRNTLLKVYIRGPAPGYGTQASRVGRVGDRQLNFLGRQLFYFEGVR